jgi:murein DD-endopeptidase MepM/ murein hydrolase activator NlpD
MGLQLRSGSGPTLRVAGLAAVVFAATGGAAASQALGPLQPPVSPTCVTSPFGPRRLEHDPLHMRFHYGLDLRAGMGTIVHAVAPGRVIGIDRKGAGGLEVRVLHDGFTAVYSHLGRLTPALLRGQRVVAAGEPLGVVGLTGLTFGPHLYFELWANGRRVDPDAYLGIPECP